jgi:nucleoside-triphosphatase THEP1
MTTVVLTGAVHVGKTTVCRSVVELARKRGYCVAGILTLPILGADGVRLGLQVQDLLSGEKRLLARMDQDWGGPRVGDYHFDPDALQWGQDAMAKAIALGCDLLVIDEIGRLELEQKAGFHHVLALLGMSVLPRCLVIVRDVLVDAFRRRLPELQFAMVEVTVQNRASIASEVAERLLLL